MEPTGPPSAIKARTMQFRWTDSRIYPYFGSKRFQPHEPTSHLPLHLVHHFLAPSDAAFAFRTISESVVL